MAYAINMEWGLCMQHIVQMYGNIVCAADWHVEGVFDFCRFYYVLGGEAAYTGADGTYGLRRGSLYVFPCNAYYRVTHSPADPFEVIWFHVGLLTSRIDRPVEIPIGEGTLAYHLLHSLACSMEDSPSSLEKLFDILYDTLSPALSQATVTNAEMALLLGRINAVSGAAYTNRQLAAMLGYSEKHFIRFFKKHVGTLPHQYMTAMRMGVAAKHLLGGRSVKETADMLGYASACNFSRDFRRHYQLSPTQYAAGYPYKP